MTISHVYTTKVTVIFDALFKMEMTDSLDTVIERASWCISEYGFNHADIMDANSGEILVTLDNDYGDFPPLSLECD